MLDELIGDNATKISTNYFPLLTEVFFCHSICTLIEIAILLFQHVVVLKVVQKKILFVMIKLDNVLVKTITLMEEHAAHAKLIIIIFQVVKV